jgi:hypothetical protein
MSSRTEPWSTPKGSTQTRTVAAEKNYATSVSDVPAIGNAARRFRSVEEPTKRVDAEAFGELGLRRREDLQGERL